MSEHLNCTSSGIFDMNTTSLEKVESLPEILINPDEMQAWSLYEFGGEVLYNNGIPIRDEYVETFHFAKQWARHMQFRSPGGTNLEAVWMECAVATDCEYITSRILHRAVGILARCWEHGEALRTLYDKNWQKEGVELLEVQKDLLERNLN